MLAVENTAIALAYHQQADHLLLAMEDGYRVQHVTPEGKVSKIFRVPVQIQPVDLVVDAKSGALYTLNFLSNTISVIPANELQVTDAFLDRLAQYRTDLLQAFFTLFTNLLQYIKDCFCNHLLVKCPACGDDDVIYLALVEVRDNKVYKICNFKKRKYVKTFPTVEYWFSMVPIIPLIKNLVGRFCCAILPDLFGDRRNKLVVQPEVGAGNQVMADNSYKAATTRSAVQIYNRTDTRSVLRNQTKGLRVVGRMAGDNLLSYAETGRRKEAGVRKQALMHSSVNDAVKELEKNSIQVTDIKPYDENKAGAYISEYTSTPQRLEPGSKVTLYQRDGKVAFYSIERATGQIVTEVPEALKEELKQLEKRKEGLANLSDLKAELAKVEARRAGVVELEAVKSELTELQSQKASIEEELAALKSQVESVKIEREVEATRLEEINTLRGEISAGIDELNRGVQDLSEMRREIKVEIAKERPVKEVAGVTPQVDLQLREIGIRTVEELSLADPRKIADAGGVSLTVAKRMIKSAQARLVVR